MYRLKQNKTRKTTQANGMFFVCFRYSTLNTPPCYVCVQKKKGFCFVGCFAKMRHCPWLHLRRLRQQHIEDIEGITRRFHHHLAARRREVMYRAHRSPYITGTGGTLMGKIVAGKRLYSTIQALSPTVGSVSDRIARAKDVWHAVKYMYNAMKPSVDVQDLAAAMV